MHPIYLSVALLGGCDGEIATKPTKSPLTVLQSTSITLPPDEATFGEGTQAALLDSKCLACHSVTMIHYQPPLDRKQWTATVTKMREAYHAPIEPEETEAVVDALMVLAPSRR